MHLAAGTSIERLSPPRGIRRYASESYMGKEFVTPESRKHVEKFWGVITRMILPNSQCETMTEERQVMILIRRIHRRFMHSKRPAAG
jgi:hypothetical protein